LKQLKNGRTNRPHPANRYHYVTTTASKIEESLSKTSSNFGERSSKIFFKWEKATIKFSKAGGEYSVHPAARGNHSSHIPFKKSL
jgi:hypothetical protein